MSHAADAMESGSPAPGRDRVMLDELLALRFLAPRLRSSARARHAAAGTHLSHLHARGVDYAESRIYQAGDDIRAMDWRVTARSGKPHTKLFREERERSLLVLLDANTSMRFGTRVRFKSVQAARAAALAAWMVVRGGDRIGGLCFGGVRASLTPRGGARGALAWAGALKRWDDARSADDEPLSEGLRRGLRMAPPGARVLLVSDGFCCDEAARPLLLRLRQRTEVMILMVADPLELAEPPAGDYSVEHAGQRLALALQTPAARQAFAGQLAHGRVALAELARRCGVPTQVIDTRDLPLSALGHLLDRGARR